VIPGVVLQISGGPSVHETGDLPSRYWHRVLIRA
jgi:hypothetical protein